MATKNDITGDSIRSRPNTKLFDNNFDSIFRKPKADPEGWIDWHGGDEHPVPVGTLVDVVHADGKYHYGVRSGVLGSMAEYWHFKHDEWPGAIIKYRLAKP